MKSKIRLGAVVEGSSGTGTVEGARRVEGRRMLRVEWHDGESTMERSGDLELITSGEE